ncbi:MAG: aminotransferase class I/II-fold pyridoxal phosphate-dependent enzyme [Verrucomicrobia bacterium]|nr:aminotransferase class I/II-fold pyridoxal phosphate-dependent enzyme [Verrucomicrobiota bacterium]
MRLTSVRVDAVSPPIIPQVADWIRTHPGTISLGQGVAGYGPPPEAWAALERMRRDPMQHRYQPVDGLPELGDAMRQRWERRLGVAVGSDRRLMVTAGANAAFQQVILALCDPGDEVLLPLPWYFNQEMALTLAHVRPVPVPCDTRHWPDLEQITRAITPRTRAIVTVSPNNPTGAVYPEPLLLAINTLCRERGLHHISDETYEAFTFGGARHRSPGAFPGASSHTICLFSLSKVFGFAGWRIGCVVMPAGLEGAMRAIQDTWLICPPVPSQWAALGCLQAPESWLESRVAEIGATRVRVLEGLHGLGSRVTVSDAEGAFYVFLRIADGPDPLELTHQLIAGHGVAVIPGTAFGLRGECSLRVAYGALTPDTATEGIGRLVSGLRHRIGA